MGDQGRKNGSRQKSGASLGSTSTSEISTAEGVRVREYDTLRGMLAQMTETLERLDQRVSFIEQTIEEFAEALRNVSARRGQGTSFPATGDFNRGGGNGRGTGGNNEAEGHGDGGLRKTRKRNHDESVAAGSDEHVRKGLRGRQQRRSVASTSKGGNQGILSPDSQGVLENEEQDDIEIGDEASSTATVPLNESVTPQIETNVISFPMAHVLVRRLRFSEHQLIGGQREGGNHESLSGEQPNNNGSAEVLGDLSRNAFKKMIREKSGEKQGTNRNLPLTTPASEEREQGPSRRTRAQDKAVVEGEPTLEEENGIITPDPRITICHVSLQKLLSIPEGASGTR